MDEGILLGPVEDAQQIPQWEDAEKTVAEDVLQLKPKAPVKKKKKSPFKLPTEEEYANQKEENKEAKVYFAFFNNFEGKIQSNENL